MKLGKHQLCLLADMASPFNALIVGDRISRSLVKRELLAPHFHDGLEKGSFYCITPLGLRVLADFFEAGKLAQFLDSKFERDRVRLCFSTKAAA